MYYLMHVCTKGCEGDSDNSIASAPWFSAWKVVGTHIMLTRSWGSGLVCKEHLLHTRRDLRSVLWHPHEKDGCGCVCAPATPGLSQGKKPVSDWGGYLNSFEFHTRVHGNSHLYTLRYTHTHTHTCHTYTETTNALVLILLNKSIEYFLLGSLGSGTEAK